MLVYTFYTLPRYFLTILFIQTLKQPLEFESWIGVDVCIREDELANGIKVFKSKRFFISR